jgi:hypothetical protein
VAQAAKLLGRNKGSLHRLMKQLGMTTPHQEQRSSI